MTSSALDRATNEGPTPTTTEPRSAERKSVVIPARAVCGDGRDIACVLREISATGAKIGLSEQHMLPTRFRIVTRERPGGFPVRLLRQRGDFADVTLDVHDPR